jgi:enoyl-CoA hydratase/carnithine racemase
MNDDNQRVRVTLDERGVAEVAMVRADKMNALDAAMFKGLIDAIDQLRGDRRVRAVVLHGEGRAFCAGLDMGRFKEMGAGQIGGTLGDIVARTHGLANGPQQVAWGWRELPVPVIAAVHGIAFGGGFQIMSGADIRIVAPDARFSIREVHWGLVPDMAGFALWRSLVRDDVLREFVYTAREFDAAEALALGFVTRIADDPHAAAMALARTIAERNPHAVRAAKRLANMAHDADARAILAAETEEQMQVIGKPNMMEAVAANLARRLPVFED